MSDVEFTYIQPDGEEKQVEAMEGMTLMEAALFNGIDGIQGLCGGICSCATCHVALEKEVYDKLDAPSEGEAEMIAMLDDHGPTSRLGCQVPIGDVLRGARIRVLGTEA